MTRHDGNWTWLALLFVFICFHTFFQPTESQCHGFGGLTFGASALNLITGPQQIEAKHIKLGFTGQIKLIVIIEKMAVVRGVWQKFKDDSVDLSSIIVLTVSISNITARSLIL